MRVVLCFRDGYSRQLAFIGFKTVAEAEAAQRFYDKSFLDASRLAVEFARKVRRALTVQKQKCFSSIRNLRPAR